MNTLYNWQTAQIDLNHHEDRVLVIHGDDESLSIELPITKTRTGGKNITISIDMFGKGNILPVELFEHDLSNKLTHEQLKIVYNSWGTALSIIISNTASVLGIEKREAKEIITLGERYGLFYQGNNNTWKIKDATIKERWRDKAKQLANSTKEIKEPESLAEGVTAYTKKMDDMTTKFQEKPEEPKKPIKHSEMKQRMIGGGRVVLHEEYTKEKHPQQDSSVIEVIEPSEEMLQIRLKELKEYKGDNIHDVVNEINAVKRKLQVFENKRASEKYKKENSTPGFSIVEGIKKEGKGLTPILMSKAKILSKKKPVPGKPLGKR